jgi:ribonucleotide reductase beta subunit family protein with ferritin-like domain|tara:strand:+ start:665 stop:1597 length:933 start_codon:yes stop_codon:yes gene_type:complete
MLTEKSLTYKPLRYQQAEDYRLQSEDIHWVVKEVEMTRDVEDFRAAPDEEREFIKNILSIFTQSDFNVAAGYLPLINTLKNNEVRGMLTSFMAREFIHQEGYAHLNESLGFPDSYYTDFLKHSETLEKDSYMQNNQFKDNFGLSLAKGILLEGISLFGSFVMLKNFERHGKYLGMCTINEWSLRDETLHVEGNAWLFRTWCQENPQAIDDTFKMHIYNMARSIVDMEKKFVDFAFGSYSPKDLSKGQVKAYLEYITDRRLLQIGLKPNYERSENPLPWMDVLNNGSSHANFFEKRVTDYSVAGMSGDYGY